MTETGKTYGFHIDRGGTVTVLTKQRYYGGRIGEQHILTGIPAGVVYRQGRHWRRSDSGQHYRTQDEAGQVAAAVAIRARGRGQ